VHWKPPKDDGGSPITHYVLERQDISLKGEKLFKKCDKSYDSNLIITGGWGTVSEIPSSDPTTFKCQDLSPKKEYKFRVKAVNKMGPSEPATFNKTILAKDPWGKHNYICAFFNR